MVDIATRNSPKEHPGELTKWTFTHIHSRFFLAMSEGVATNTYHVHTMTARSGLQLVYHVIIILLYLARNLSLERSFSVNTIVFKIKTHEKVKKKDSSFL